MASRAISDIKIGTMMDNDISLEVARLRWHHAALRFELSTLRHAQTLRRKFDPTQPRVPAGEPGGGQWTSEESSEIDPFSRASS
jgi:hypothetical protein